MIIAAALLIAIIFAELGCVILWQRYAYFGDGLVHACVFSSSLSLLCGLSPLITVAITAVLYSTIVQFISKHSEHNVAISIASGILLAMALIINSIFGDLNSLNQLLVGDILFTNDQDVISLAIICTLTTILLLLFLRKIILISLSPELAQINGINTKNYKLVIFALMGIIITVILPIVGGLLCTALLILPAAIARLVSHSPKQMILLSIITAIIINMGGLYIAFAYNMPVSPAILIVGSILYIILHMDRATKGLSTHLFNRK